MRRIVLFVVVVIIAALVFWRLGWRWSAALLLAFGLLYSLPLRRSQSITGWLFTSTLLISIIVGGWLASPRAEDARLFARGGLAGAGLFLISGFVGVLVCSRLFIAIRGVDDAHAWKYMLGFAGTSLPIVSHLPFDRLYRGFQLIDEGQIAFSFPPGRGSQVMGPAILIVQSGNAVLLQRGGHLTRILGPGFYYTELWEFVSDVVDLRLQKGAYPPREETLTKDGIPLEIRFTVLYRIMGDEATLISEGKYLINREAIRRALLSAADWRSQTEFAARAILRDTIAAYRLDEIYDPWDRVSRGESTPRLPLQDTVRERLNDESKRWGVEIVKVTLDEIHMPDRVKERMLDAWDIDWAYLVERARAETQSQALVRRAQAHADALTTIEDAKGRVRVDLIRAILGIIDRDGAATLNDPATIRFLGAIAVLSKSMLVDETLAHRYLDAIEAVATSDGTKTILPGAGTNFRVNLSEER